MKAAPFALASAIALGGCATTTIDDNFAAIERFSRDQAGSEARWLRSETERAEMEAEVDRLLAEPLGRDDAVRLALGYSPAFQTVLAEAAATSADVSRSARLPNPTFSFERLVRSGGGERTELDIGRALSFSLLDVLLLPVRLERAELRQQQTRLQASMATLKVITDVRTAWVEAVAAAQIANYHEGVVRATSTSAELGRRMQSAGNFSRLERAREQALHADAVSTQIRARQSAVRAREALVQLLGLPPEKALALKLPERLPDLPVHPLDEETVGRAALDERLDVRRARAELEATAKDLGLTRVTSVVNGLEVAAVRNSETGERAQRGFEIELPLPLFDFGDAGRAGDQSRYLAAFNRTAQIARNATSQVRTVYDSYRNSHDLARHYRDEIVPLRKSIAEEAVLQYNGMFLSVFELLAETRSQVASVIQAIEAEREFWIAETALHATLLGTPVTPSTSQPSSAAPAPAAEH